MIQFVLRRAWPSLVLAALIVFTAVFVGRACYFRNDIRFLTEHSPAHWIIYPSPPSQFSHPDVALDAVFQRSFSIDSVPAAAQLRVRAFRTCTIQLNGNLIPAKFESNRWKQESRFEVAQFLRKGQNEISVTVTNSSSPPALWLALSSPDTILITDNSWKSSLAGATWLPAALATDPVPFGFLGDALAERTIPSLLKIWPIWLIFAGVSVAILFFCHRWLAGGNSHNSVGQKMASSYQNPPLVEVTRGKKGRNRPQNVRKTDRRRQNITAQLDQPSGFVRLLLMPQGRWVALTRILFVLIALFWTALFLHNSQYLLPNYGFDFKGYIGYIDHFRTTWSVPMPNQGHQMHHPPLYPFLAAVILDITGYPTSSANGVFTIRIFNLVLAICNVFMIMACLRLIFPEHPRRWIIGMVFAGFLPMHMYLYQYPTNHILAGTMASITLYFVLRILCVPSSGVREYVSLGFALGLALLSMVTIGILVLPIGLALVAKLYTDRDQISRNSAFLRILVLCLVVFGICGWYYVRVWINCGTPIVANMGSMGSGSGEDIPWWQDPGFRTWSDYFRFGESLYSPLYSVWYSVWDGLYSTLWGDTYCASAPYIEFRPPWSYDFMIAGMLLALLPMAAILLGSGVAIYRFLRKPTIIWTLLLGVSFLFALFLTYGTIILPCFGGVKAFYGLPAVVPLCAFAALGLDLLSTNRRWLRGIIYIVLGVWVLNVAATYWISPFALETKRSVAIRLASEGNVAEAAVKLEELLKDHPDDTLNQVILAQRLLQDNLNNRAKQVLEFPPGQRDLSSRHLMLGILSGKEGRTKDAIDEYHKALELAPNDIEIACAYAAAISAGPDVRAAIDAFRNGLRINPFSGECHTALSQLYLKAGDEEAAHQHMKYLQSLKEYLRQTESPK